MFLHRFPPISWQNYRLICKLLPLTSHSWAVSCHPGVLSSIKTENEIGSSGSLELRTVDCGLWWRTTLSRKYIKRGREREREYWRGGQDRTGAANGVKWEPLVKSRAAGGGDGWWRITTSNNEQNKQTGYITSKTLHYVFYTVYIRTEEWESL